MKLCELNIFELEWELDVIRGLPCDGDLDELVIRLREAMENEGLDPEEFEFGKNDGVQAKEKVAPVAGRNAGASSGNFDMAQVMAAMNQMMEKQAQHFEEVIGELRRLNRKIETYTQEMKQDIKQSYQGTKEEIKQFNQVIEQEIMEEIEQEEVKKVDIKADHRIEGSEEKPLDAELDGASARVVQTVDTVELMNPTFNGTSSVGILEHQFEAATLQNDCSIIPEYTEGTGMDAFREGVGDLDNRGGVLLSPGVMFAEAVAHALTGEAVLDIVKPAVRIQRAELEQSYNCGAVGNIWPRGNWPGSHWPLAGAQSGHRRMRCWIYGRAGHILRNGWKRTRKKVRAPSPLWRISKVDRRRVVERKGPRKSDVLKMDALMGRPGQVDVGHHGRMEEKESIIDVERMQISQAGEWIGDKIRQQQLEDPDLPMMMVRFVEERPRPAGSKIADGGPALKGNWSQWDGLSIDEGCWKRMWESSNGRSGQSLVVVTESGIAEVLRRYHGGAGEAHLGINGTMAKLRVKFYFAGCRQSVAVWCRGCERCTGAKGPGNEGFELVQMTNGEATIGRMAVDHRTRARCDVRANDGGFEKGQFAWLHRRQRTMGFSERLWLEWRDPYRVIDGMEDVICRERDGRCVLGELHGGSRVIHLERTVLYTGGGLDPVRDEQVWAEGSVTN